MAEEPRESSKFDVSDLETTSPETPKAKRKAGETKLESVKVVKPAAGSEASLPGVHERKPRKRAVRKSVSSEGRMNASVAGEIDLTPAAPAKSEVEEALDIVRETAEESAWDAKIAEAKKNIQEEEDAKAKAGEEAEWDAKIAEAKKGAEDDERARRIAAMGERVDRAMAEEEKPKFSESEEAWFKQGEDEGHVAAQAAMQHEEEGRKIADVRRQIAETYDATRRETVLDTDEDVDAAAKQAEAMVASGRLNGEMFNAKDYRYLLVQQARIDKELETAGWWAARKLRSEMKEIRKELDGYESQIRHAMSERAPSGALTAREKEEIRYKGPAEKPALPQGSGTTIHKPGFFSRLFGRK